MTANTSRPVTIYDVARHADVSASTVSRVINGKANVDPALVAKVRGSVEATGYVGSLAGRALRRRVSNLWAIVVPDIQNSFFSQIIVQLESLAIDAGYSLIVCNTQESLAREVRYLEVAVQQRMAGVIIAAASHTKSDLSGLTSARIRTILIDRRVKGFRGEQVFVDNRRAGALAAEHLLRRGYRQPACISGPADVSPVEERVRGFRESLNEAGVSLPRNLIWRGELDPLGGQHALDALLSGPNPPDAVYVTNGPFTAGAYFAALERGLLVPGQFGLVGTDDQMWGRMVRPRLTVVSQPVDEICQVLGGLLLRGENEPRSPRVMTLEPRLIERESA